MNNFYKKLCGLLLFNLFIIFSFCSSSYAVDTTPVMENLNDYEYRQTIPESIYSKINEMESREDVIDNTYYYFIVPTSFENGLPVFKTFLINKSFVKDIYFRFKIDNSNGMYYTGLYIYFNNNAPNLSTGSGIHNVLRSWLLRDLRTGGILNYFDDNSYLDYINITGLDSSFKNYVFTVNSYSYFNDGLYLMPFATNYPYYIKGSSVDFYNTSIVPTVKKQSPYLLNSHSSLQMSNWDTLGILSSLFSFPVDINFKIINTSTSETVVSLKCSDYEKYISRSDIDDPFSPLSYNIPITTIPDFELLENTKYDFQVSYNVGSATIYNHNYILTAIPFNHKQSEVVIPRRWRRRRR